MLNSIFQELVNVLRKIYYLINENIDLKKEIIIMKFKKVLSLSCILAVAGAGGMATSMTVFANTIQEGTTLVTYDNEKVLPDENGEYGMIIPVAVTFSDTEMTANTDVEITGINGYELSNWRELSVQASVKSANAYKLKLNGNESKYATYGLKYDGNNTEFISNQEFQKINKNLGVGGAHDVNVKKVTGIATLKDKSKATKKGQYIDTLTYSFKEIINQKA